MKVPFLHGQGDNEAPQKKENGAVDINGRSCLGAQYAQQRIEDHRQQCGGKKRYGIRNPPDGHKYGHRRHAGDHGFARFQINKQQNNQKQAKAQP